MSVIVLFGLYFVKSWLLFPLKFRYTRKMLLFGVPLGLLALSSTLSPTIERGLIATHIDLYSIGVYALSLKIASLVVIVDGIFNMAWGPFSMAIFKEKDAASVYNIVLKFILILSMFVVLCIKATAPLLIKLLGNEQYNYVGDLILPLCLALSVNSITAITGIGINLSMKSYLNLIPFISSVVLSLALLTYSIPIFGLMGVVYSLLFVNSFKMLVTSIIARKVYRHIRIDFEKVIVAFILITTYYHLLARITDGVFTWFVCGLILLLAISFLWFRDIRYVLNVEKKIN